MLITTLINIRFLRVNSHRMINGAKMLIKELKKLKLQSEVISIERSCHAEELTGRLCDINEHIISMFLLTDEGNFDGFTVFPIDQVIEVYWGNREHQAIAQLMSNTAIPVNTEIKANQFRSIILELNKSHNSICFHESNNEDSFDMGAIEDYDDTWMKLHTFSNKKTLSRMHKLILWEDISRVVVNSPYQNKIVTLHQSGI